ncbi:hypothetical protein [Mycolicibacterium fortuitum]|uniref:hypothetical protein n=1 Tax=Mycolicibacterium fortuitum TaxID=1766 RepID=UPI00149050AC|nr:hypothetical protein [Mycolicibacterium fortuitum]
MNALLADTGVYEDDYYRFDGLIDRKTFDMASMRLGRGYGPALLFDLAMTGSLDLGDLDMVGVVADVWSAAEYPEDAMERALWLEFFEANGYTDDMRAVSPPTIRGRRAGEVWVAEAHPEALMAYIGADSRGESEYVLDPDGLSNIRRVGI